MGDIAVLVKTATGGSAVIEGAKVGVCQLVSVGTGVADMGGLVDVISVRGGGGGGLKMKNAIIVMIRMPPRKSAKLVPDNRILG